MLIFASSLLYTMYTYLCISLSTSLAVIYKLNQWEISLIYLPFRISLIVSTFFSGPIVDKTYLNFRIKHRLSADKVIGDDLNNFPIEKARLRII